MLPTILILEITLLDTTIPIWRMVEVKQNSTLHQLHAVIQVAMGWTNSHLYSFTRSRDEHHIEFILPEYDVIDELYTGNNPKEFKLKDIFKTIGDRIFYTYDFGDSWRHKVIFRGVKYEKSPFGFPACVAGAGCCPPEDVGGIHGFAEMLKVLEEGDKKSIREFDEWIGHRFDPADFDALKFLVGFDKQVRKVVKQS